jgi:hypothetical protein
MRGLATAGGTPIRQRVDPMVEKAKRIRRLGQEIAMDGLSLLRDLIHEQQLLCSASWARPHFCWRASLRSVR